MADSWAQGVRALVSGGAGFIGSHLVDALVEQNVAEVIVVDNFFLGNLSNLDQASNRRGNMETYRLDAGNFSAMQEIVTRHGINTVFNLGVVPLPTSISFPEWTVQSNIAMTLAFCEIARLGLIENFVQVSSSEVYGTARYVPMPESHPLDATTPYAASKAACDQIVDSYRRTFGIRARIVRPFNNYGPRQNQNSYAGIIPIVISRMLRGQPIEIHGDGMQTRDFTFVKDTASLIVSLSNDQKTEGETINVATGVETSIRELVDMVKKVMGKENHPVEFVDPRIGDVRRHCADISKLLELQLSPPSALSISAVEETVAWYRNAN